MLEEVKKIFPVALIAFCLLDIALARELWAIEYIQLGIFLLMFELVVLAILLALRLAAFKWQEDQLKEGAESSNGNNTNGHSQDPKPKGGGSQGYKWKIAGPEDMSKLIKSIMLLILHMVALIILLFVLWKAYAYFSGDDSYRQQQSKQWHDAVASTNPQSYTIPTLKPPSGYFATKLEISPEKDPNTIGRWRFTVPANHEPTIEERFILTGAMVLKVDDIENKVIVNPQRQNKETANDWHGTKLLPVPSTGKPYEKIEGIEDLPLAGSIVADCYKLTYQNNEPPIQNSSVERTWALKPGLTLSGDCAIALRVEDTKTDYLSGDPGPTDNIGNCGGNDFIPGCGFVVIFTQEATLNRSGVIPQPVPEINMPKQQF